jgi:hypothetical protein
MTGRSKVVTREPADGSNVQWPPAKQKKEDEEVTCEAKNSTQAFANLVSRQQN